MSNAVRKITRNQLAMFLPDQRAIRAFEQVLEQLSDLLPDDIASINQKIADSGYDVGSVRSLIESTIQDVLDVRNDLGLLTADHPLIDLDDLSPPQSMCDNDDLNPPFVINGMAYQEPDSVDITGGNVAADIMKAKTTGGFVSSDGSSGYTGTLTTASLVGKTVTIKDGIITSIA